MVDEPRLKKILVVDDEPDVMKVVLYRLKKAGYEIVNAGNGQEALDILRAGNRFDLIILDLVMPVMNGYEFCTIANADPELTDIPIIILSASATHDIKERMKKLKVSDYVTKPFDQGVLLSKVKAILG